VPEADGAKERKVNRKTKEKTMPKTADNYKTSITGRFPPLASTGGNDAEALENHLAQSLATSTFGKTTKAVLGGGQ
jgi:hypothetical protein